MTEALTIKSWAEADRPREAVKARQKHASDELIALLLTIGKQGGNSGGTERILGTTANDLPALPGYQ
jgi:hypothetical protein